MNRRVIDASAVLALIFFEEGAELLQGIIDRGAVISTVNLVEVLTKMLDQGYSMDRAQRAVARLNLSVEDFTRSQADLAAGLRLVTRPAGLSLGDRACLALAHELQLPAVTAERSWLGLDVNVFVETIR